MPDTATHLADIMFDGYEPPEQPLPLVSTRDFLSTYADDARERY